MLWPIMENLLHCRAVGVISHIINQVQYLITEHRPFLAQRNPHCYDSAVRKMHGSSGNMLEINNIHSRAFFSRSINCILNYVKCIFILKSSHFQLQCMLYLRGQSLPTFKKKQQNCQSSQSILWKSHRCFYIHIFYIPSDPQWRLSIMTLLRMMRQLITAYEHSVSGWNFNSGAASVLCDGP